MIITTVGSTGSGKSLSLVKNIMERGYKSFTNFELLGVKNFHRIEYEEVVKENVLSTKKDGTAKKTSFDINFEFWEKETKRKQGFDIYIDEAQMNMSSRSSMSKENKVWNQFISQIRKILGTSEKNHIYITTQRPHAIDVHIRDLTHIWILCNKIVIHGVEIKTETDEGVKMLPLCVITRSYFKSLDELEYYSRFQNDNIPFHQDWFIGNNFYKYYRSHEIIDFRNKYF